MTWLMSDPCLDVHHHDPLPIRLLPLLVLDLLYCMIMSVSLLESVYFFGLGNVTYISHFYSSVDFFCHLELQMNSDSLGCSELVSKEQSLMGVW